MHVHSSFSADGKSRLEDYTELFWDKGTGTLSHFRSGLGTCPLVPNQSSLHLGFAEHVDFLPECGSYNYMDPLEYLKAVRELRDMGFDFHAGAEIDYVKQAEADISDHLKKYPYEYTLCSVHMIDGRAISDSKFPPDDASLEFLLDIAEKYYRELEAGIKSGLFDVVGHIGVFTRRMSDEDRKHPKMAGLISQAEYETARLCAGSGMIVEVNTSGLFKANGTLLPGLEFLKNYRAFGGRFVCIGSDAHSTTNVGRGFVQARDALKASGFEYITLPWDREQQIRLG